MACTRAGNDASAALRRTSLFGSVDANKDGQVSREEFVDALRRGILIDNRNDLAGIWERLRAREKTAAEILDGVGLTKRAASAPRSQAVPASTNEPPRNTMHASGNGSVVSQRAAYEDSSLQEQTLPLQAQVYTGQAEAEERLMLPWQARATDFPTQRPLKQSQAAEAPVVNPRVTPKSTRTESDASDATIQPNCDVGTTLFVPFGNRMQSMSVNLRGSHNLPEPSGAPIVCSPLAHAMLDMRQEVIMPQEVPPLIHLGSKNETVGPRKFTTERAELPEELQALAVHDQRCCQGSVKPAYFLPAAPPLLPEEGLQLAPASHYGGPLQATRAVLPEAPLALAMPGNYTRMGQDGVELGHFPTTPAVLPEEQRPLVFRQDDPERRSCPATPVVLPEAPMALARRDDGPRLRQDRVDPAHFPITQAVLPEQLAMEYRHHDPGALHDPSRFRTTRAVLPQVPETLTTLGVNRVDPRNVPNTQAVLLGEPLASATCNDNALAVSQQAHRGLICGVEANPLRFRTDLHHVPSLLPRDSDHGDKLSFDPSPSNIAKPDRFVDIPILQQPAKEDPKVCESKQNFDASVPNDLRCIDMVRREILREHVAAALEEAGEALWCPGRARQQSMKLAQMTTLSLGASRRPGLGLGISARKHVPRILPPRPGPSRSLSPLPRSMSAPILPTMQTLGLGTTSNPIYSTGANARVSSVSTSPSTTHPNSINSPVVPPSEIMAPVSSFQGMGAVASRSLPPPPDPYSGAHKSTRFGAAKSFVDPMSNCSSHRRDSLFTAIDANRDAAISREELYAAVHSGVITIGQPPCELWYDVKPDKQTIGRAAGETNVKTPPPPKSVSFAPSSTSTRADSSSPACVSFLGLNASTDSPWQDGHAHSGAESTSAPLPLQLPLPLTDEWGQRARADSMAQGGQTGKSSHSSVFFAFDDNDSDEESADCLEPESRAERFNTALSTRSSAQSVPLSNLFSVSDVARRGTLAAQALGVSKTAKRRTVAGAFHKGARKLHPDKGGKKDDFQVLREAYATMLADRT